MHRSRAASPTESCSSPRRAADGPDALLYRQRRRHRPGHPALRVLSTNSTAFSPRSIPISARTPPTSRSTTACPTVSNSISTPLISPSIAHPDPRTPPASAIPTWASSGTSTKPHARSAFRRSPPASTSNFQPAMTARNSAQASPTTGSTPSPQEPFSDKTRLNANFGFLFAGNTSTGVLGIQTTRGHVYTGGISLAARLQPAPHTWR